MQLASFSFLPWIGMLMDTIHTVSFTDSDTVLRYEIIQIVLNCKNGDTLSAATAEPSCT